MDGITRNVKMKRIAIAKKHVVLFIAALASTAAILSCLFASTHSKIGKDSSRQDMALPDNGPPPFDPTITKDALVQIYREICTNVVKEAAFLLARNVLCEFSRKAYNEILAEKGESFFASQPDSAESLKAVKQRELMQREGTNECFNYIFYVKMREFEDEIARLETGEYPSDDSHDEEWYSSYVDSLGTNRAYYLSITSQMNSIRKGGLSCGVFISPIESEAREYTISQLADYEDWEAQYHFWFYRLILHYYYTRNESDIQ